MLGKMTLMPLLLCFVFLQDAGCGQRGHGQPYVPGQVLVKFHEGVSQDEAQALHNRLGSTVLVNYGKLNIDLVAIKNGLAIEEAIKLYQEDPIVAYAEPNYTRSMQPSESGDTN
jgi:hypothetical protein